MMRKQKKQNKAKGKGWNEMGLAEVLFQIITEEIERKYYQSASWIF